VPDGLNYSTIMSPTDDRVKRLEDQARRVRADILKMTHDVGAAHKGHPGGALSAADLVTALYFDVMNVDPANPGDPDRDRFILSKGHTCPVLYAALGLKGYFDRSNYQTFRTVGGILQGHPDMKKTPGVDMTAGSLGHGLSAGLGMALAGRIDRRSYRTYVVLGDGECQEGLVWEAAMAAGHYGVGTLTAVVDVNGLQSCFPVVETLAMEPFADKWRAFRWNAIEIDGHDMGQILTALEGAAAETARPTVILARTVKGKGVSFMENDNVWHQKAPNDEQYRQALSELGLEDWA
jgi:transketolase